MIEADRVTHRAGEMNLVDDVSLKVRGGEILAVVGPNGAGKSTLLRLLTGELLPLSGEIRMGGRPLGDWKIRERARVRAVLPQYCELSFPFSSYDVVILGRSPHTEGRETLRDQSIARLALSATDALAYEERLYPTLSGGERQRVHAARAMAQIWEGDGLRVLLMDEPTASLDLSHQHVILQEARRMADGGCAVVCVLHDLNLASQYADTIAVMSAGKLRAYGTPSEILSQDLVCDVFDVDARVVPHPTLDCPLIVPMGPALRSAPQRSASVGGLL